MKIHGIWSSVYVLKSGRLKLSRVSRNGKELILDLIEPGDIFGETNLLDRAPEDTLGEALEDSNIYAFSGVKFKRFLLNGGRQTPLTKAS